MKLQHLIYIAAGIIFIGCSSPTHPGSSNGIHVVSPTNLVSIAVGGLTFPAHDTSKGVGLPSNRRINFDLLPNAVIKNDSNITLLIFEQWRFGILKSINGRDSFLTDIDGLPQSSVKFGATLAPGGSIAADIPNFLGVVPSVDEKLIHQRFACQLVISTQSDTVLYSATQILDSSFFTKRYHGFIYTNESSPDPLASVDLPLDLDISANAMFKSLALYPNPNSGGTTTSQINVLQPLDSLMLTVFITPNVKFRVNGGTDIKIATYDFGIETTLPSGLYRVEITGWKKDSVFHSHQNLCIRKP